MLSRDAYPLFTGTDGAPAPGLCCIAAWTAFAFSLVRGTSGLGFCFKTLCMLIILPAVSQVISASLWSCTDMCTWNVDDVCSAILQSSSPCTALIANKQQCCQSHFCKVNQGLVTLMTIYSNCHLSVPDLQAIEGSMRHLTNVHLMMSVALPPDAAVNQRNQS